MSITKILSSMWLLPLIFSGLPGCVVGTLCTVLGKAMTIPAEVGVHLIWAEQRPNCWRNQLVRGHNASTTHCYNVMSTSYSNIMESS